MEDQHGPGHEGPPPSGPENSPPPSDKGFKMGELEGKLKRFGLEIALCAIFILTAIFTLVWSGGMLLWSVILSMIFAIVGVLTPRAMDKAITAGLEFVYKEKITSIVMAVVGVLISIFVPAVIFALIGLLAGTSFALHAGRH